MAEIIKEYGQWIMIGEAALFVAALLWALWQYFSTPDDGPLHDEIRGLRNTLRKAQNELVNYQRAYAQVVKERDDYKREYEQAARSGENAGARDSAKAEAPVAEPARKTKTAEAKYEYLQEANGGKFPRLMASGERCYFRTWEEGGVRKYEFAGNVDKALANINAIFDDVCEIEGRRNGATEIENVSAGTLDAELRIVSRARIRLK